MPGLVSVLCAYLANAVVVRTWDRAAVRWIVPIVEEVAKTESAVLLGAPILDTHFVFALVESAYDLSRRSRLSLLGAGVSLLGHILFGLATVEVLKWTGSVWLGVWVSIGIHMAWNNVAMRAEDRGPENR